MTPATIALNLPSFLYAVFVLYWSLPIGALLGVLKFAEFRRPRRDGHAWATMLCRCLRVRFRRQGKNELYRDGTCIYLCNHRSWADFFIDTYLTEGRGMLLSRMLVFYVFPVFMVVVRIIKAGILFKRIKLLDKEKFNMMIDERIRASPCQGVLVFPEGTRSQRPESLPLRKGMLHYAWTRKAVVQIVISTNKELVLNEKKLVARFDVIITTGNSAPIDPKDFPDFDTFFTHVNDSWLKLWQAVYHASPEDVTPALIPSYNQEKVPDYEFPLMMRIQMFLFTCLSLVLLALFLYLYVSGVLFILSLFGLLKQAAMVCLIGLYMASFWRAGIIHT